MTTERSDTPDYSSREARIQRVRDFLKVWDQCSGQGQIVITGAATVLWTEDLREVLSAVPSETGRLEEKSIWRLRAEEVGELGSGEPPSDDKPERQVLIDAIGRTLRLHEGHTFDVLAKRIADEVLSLRSAVAPSIDNRLIEACAVLAECADPDDGRDHGECPFCTIAGDIRKLKGSEPQSAKGEWTRVTERTMPPEEDNVLVFGKDSDEPIIAFHLNGRWCYAESTGTRVDAQWWMPLPSAPTDSGSAKP